MQLIKPTKFPHVHPYAYTRRGFDRRVRKRLRLEGFTVREIERLRQRHRILIASHHCAHRCHAVL